MKYFISFMFLITSVSAHATGAVSVPTFVPSTPHSELDVKCKQAVENANKSFSAVFVLNEQGTISAIESMQGGHSGIRGQGATGTVVQRTGAAVNAGSTDIFSKALGICEKGCAPSLNANWNDLTTEGREKREAIGKNFSAARDAISECRRIFRPVIVEGTVATAQNLNAGAGSAAVRDAANVGPSAPTNPQEETWFQRNGAYVVGAGMLGVAGMALLSNSGSKSGSQQQQQNSSPSPSPSPTTTTTACTSDSDYNNSACTDTLVTSCASATSNLCAAFTNNYCGLDDANDVTPSGSGAGNKTTFCRSKVSARFCATGNSTCATCEYLTQQSKDICKTNPTLCVAQNTPEQIAAKQAACPSDPLYADASILQGYGSNVDGSLDQPNLPSGTTSTLVSTNPSTTSNSIGTTTGSTAGSTTPTTSKNTATGTTVFTGKYNSSLSTSSSSSKPGITSASATPASGSNRKPAGSSETFSGGQGAYATASAYRGAASEVSESLGRNLFDKNSKTLNIWCKSVACQSVAARSVTN